MNLVLRMARRVLPSRLALMGAASAGTLGLVGLVALAGAAIPSSDGAINGCYDKANGQLRVIDTDKAACKNSETSISWNEAGDPGPQGEQGPAGPTGPQGPAGEPGGSITSLDQLEGIDCTTGSGLPGGLAVISGSPISLECFPAAPCGDDTIGDLPADAYTLNPISGDDPQAPTAISVNGIICEGDADWFRVSINEDLGELTEILGEIRLQASPGDSLRVTVFIESPDGEVIVNPINGIGNSTVTASGLARVFLTLPDQLGVDQAMQVLIKVDGPTAASENTYTVTAYGAGTGGP